MDRGDSFPLPSDDVMLGLSALDEDFPLLDQADEPFLSALVDNWPDLQHEQVGLPWRGRTRCRQQATPKTVRLRRS